MLLPRQKSGYQRPHLKRKPASSVDIVLDIGSAMTVAYRADHRIIFREPTIVAVSSQRGVRKAIAVGTAVHALTSSAGAPAELVHPLICGVIVDFAMAETMIRYFVTKVLESIKRPQPSVMLLLPGETTMVERRAIRDAARTAGAQARAVICRSR